MDAVRNYHRRLVVILACIALAMLFAALLAVYAGSYQVSFFETARAIFNRAADPRVNVVVRNMRLPRALTALLCGWALGITGCVLQAILRNPLASSSTLGISQGAAFGAAFAIVMLGAGTTGNAGSMLISGCAFSGGIAVSLVILALSRFVRLGPEAMVLAGVAISALFSGATTLIQYFADDVQLTRLVFWTFGDLGRCGWREIRILLAVTLVVSVFFLCRRWKYNVLESGEESAINLGVSVGRERLVNMLACSVAAAVVVSFAGLISFIGLIAPHIAKRIVGNNHTWLLPSSAFIGAALMLAGDMAARLAAAPVVLPIGAITSFLGAPLFLYLLFRGAASK